jgi:hypothetical protein
MFIGIGLNVVWALLFFNGNNCMCTNPFLMLSAAVVMYGSYLFLFVQFFIGRYFGRKAHPEGKPTEQKASSTCKSQKLE